MSPGLGEHTRTVQACLFTLAGEPFAVEIGSAREVVFFDGYTLVPGAPPALLGVANLRGTLMPILDVQPLLGFGSRAPERRTSTLILADRSLQAAVAIDGVLGLETFEEVLPVGEDLPRAYREFARGLLPRGDRPVTLLDAYKVLGALRAAVRHTGGAAGGAR